MMSRFLYIALCLFLLGILFSDAQTDEESVLLRKYERADSLYEYSGLLAGSEAEEERLSLEALRQFESLIPLLSRNHKDSLLFHALWKKAILNQYFDSSSDALHSYLDAVRIDSSKNFIPDSFYFQPLLYAGSIYHDRQDYDSAEWYYDRAKLLSSKYQDLLSESQRVYNRLGALYYTTGNYQDAITYFQQALKLLNPGNTLFDYLQMGYRNNIASCLLKLKDYSAAREIYIRLQDNPLISTEVIHNIGITFLEEGKAAEALRYFRRLNPAVANPLLPTQLGRAFELLGQPDSAAYYFGLAANQLSSGENIRLTNAGINDRYLSSFLLTQKKFSEAAESARQGIIKIYPAAADWENSPTLNFSGILSFEPLYQLFSNYALAQTAFADSTGDFSTLELALKSWENAYRLAAFVAETYSSDDAQLFLAALRSQRHAEPLNLAYRLYTAKKEQHFLDKAFYFDQSQKAAIISMQQARKELKLSSPEAKGLLDEQAKLRRRITAIAGTNNSKDETPAKDSLIQSLEYALLQQEEQLSRLPEYKSRNLGIHVPPIADIQEILSEKEQLLSYSISEDELFCIGISSDSSFIERILLTKDFDHQLRSFLAEFYDDSFQTAPDSASPINATTAGVSVFEKVWRPIGTHVHSGNTITIIPGGLLAYLPFEAIRDDSGKYLIEKFQIQYQYNAAILARSKTDLNDAKVLGLAPFAHSGHRIDNRNFAALPQSLKELEGTAGKKLVDQEATRNALQQDVNHYAILHLATHAEAEDSASSASRIYLYPSENSQLADLTEKEVRSMSLDSTDLVILSACETGTGRLAAGEGILSLSRAFRYAGCPNIITSMWRADDRSTAFIMQAFYEELHSGRSTAAALRMAKLKWLHQTNIRPTLKRPVYWAQLVFIGDLSASQNKKNWIFYLLGGILAIVLAIFFFRKRRKAQAETG